MKAELLLMAGVVLAGIVLVGGFLARRKGVRSVDAGSVSARWLAQANWERDE